MSVPLLTLSVPLLALPLLALSVPLLVLLTVSPVTPLLAARGPFGVIEIYQRASWARTAADGWAGPRERVASAALRTNKL